MDRYVSAEEARRRWPRLVRVLRWVGILAATEAGCCLRDYLLGRDGGPRFALLLRCGGGEAVAHWGGPAEMVRHAARRETRKAARLASRGEEVDHG